MLRYVAQIACRQSLHEACTTSGMHEKGMSMLLENLSVLGIPSLSIWRGAKRAATELRPGNLISQDGKLLHVTKSQYQQGVGRGHGMVHVEFKDIQTNNKVLQRLRPGDTLETVIMEAKEFQVLYREGGVVHVMDNSTFEQSAVNLSVFGDKHVFVAENSDVVVHFFNGEAITADLPTTVQLKVREAPPVNEAKSGVMPKLVLLENGVQVQVPGYISTGDVLVIKTADSSFVKKAS